MKRMLLSVCCFSLLYSVANAQKGETFDILTYKTPKGWQKKDSPSALQLGVDGAKGTCLVMVFKAVPGTNDAKANFKSSWDALAKETFKVSGKPEMQPATKENGWNVESGAATYDNAGKKGIALLLTMTGASKVVNILVITDTDSYQADITAFLESIQLPKMASTPTKPDTTKPEQPIPSPAGGFTFTTTNFDDGWTSTAQSDWVAVTKGNLKVLVHYPNKKADAYNSVLKNGLVDAWNILVAPRYVSMSNFELKPIQSFESIDFAEADAVDKSTGKTVHVVLFKKHFYNGSGKYLEFITGSKSEFEQEFGAYHNNEFGWDKLVNMQTRNKFAVSSSDLAGKWSTSESSTLTYYYVNSGNVAGATATSTADSFTFSKSGTYESDHSGASGMVGNQKFSRVVYKGKVSTDKWTMTLTDRFKGESEKYTCQFEAVKGGRILRLTDKRNSTYSLVKQ